MRSGEDGIVDTAAVAPHKLARPRPTAPARARLVTLLDDASSVVLVAAGAGFGKSTCLSAWTDTIGRPVAWLTLDRADDDAVRLVRGIVAALENALGGIGLTEVGHSVRPGRITQALDEIERRLLPAGPLVLVVDDVHQLTHPSAVDVLDALHDVLPDGSQVVLSGRSIPPIRTARRAVAGDLTSIGPADLRLDPDESWSVLDEFRGHVDHDVLASLVERLEGWPAGVQFVALGLRAAISAGVVVTDSSTASDDLTDYFQQEFLRALPAADLEFLVRTSVLDRLSGDLCDHVLGATDSARRLEALVVSGNAFVSPTGGSGTFHYHPLFADVLLDELRATDPELESTLRARAIDWHERRGEWGDAVQVALDGRGCVPAAPLIVKHLVPAISAGEIATIGRWIDHFEPARIRQDPLLALAAAWFALFSNRPGEMSRWLDAAEEIGYDGALPDGTRDLPTATAAVRMLAGTGGVRATAVHARRILDAGPAGGPWRSVAGIQYAASTQFSDRDADPGALYADAEFLTRGFPPAHAVALAHLALEAVFHRDLTTANRCAEEAREEVFANGLDELAHVALVFGATALVHAHTGAHADSSEASRHANELLHSVDALHTRSHIHHHLVLAEAAFVRHDRPEAQVHLRTARARLPQEPDAVVLHDWCERLERRFAGPHGRGGEIDLTPAEVRVLEQLASHRTLAEIGRHLYVSRNTVKTHTVSIYRKLVVTGRSEAVERAIDLGLIEDVDRVVVNLQ